MDRFTIPERKGGKSAMRIVKKKNLLAFFDFQDNDTGLLYRDFKLMDGKNGRFVGSPTGEKYKDKEGKERWPEYVSAIYDPDAKNKRNADGQEFFDTLTEVASEEFDRLDDGEEAEDDEPPKRSRSSSKRSGAGPMNRSKSRVEDDDEGDDELPF